MHTKRKKQYHLESHHFLLIFWFATALLFGGRHLIADSRQGEEQETASTAQAREARPRQHEEIHLFHHSSHIAPSTTPLPDSIEEASRAVDKLLLCQRKPLVLLDAQGNPLHNKVQRLDVSELFNDLNDVQLNTASVIGVPECETRDDINTADSRYVYIGASPYYDIDELTYSVPYLVPRAAILLDEIGHAFLDSLTAKGIPFHKLVVTSVLRTNEDVAKLTRFNANASENSCHRFGTTFDIAYSTFYRVSDPDGEKQVEWSARELYPILAEVLNDQHNLGTCYIKHEVRKRCFHITCR